MRWFISGTRSTPQEQPAWWDIYTPSSRPFSESLSMLPLLPSTPGVIYPVAALCVIYDPRTGRQSYHEGHLGDVINLTVSSCRRFAASGDAADPPRVHVWDAVTGAGEAWALKEEGFADSSFTAVYGAGLRYAVFITLRFLCSKNATPCRVLVSCNFESTNYNSDRPTVSSGEYLR